VRVQKIGPVLLGLLVVLAAASPGCGGGGDTAGTGGASSSSADASSASSASNASSSSSGMGGAGGAPTNYGPPATETVTAGEVCKSPSYKMVFTMGQPTQNQEKTTSTSYRLQGGLVGANGSLP